MTLENQIHLVLPANTKESVPRRYDSIRAACDRCSVQRLGSAAGPPYRISRSGSNPNPIGFVYTHSH
jgi:hypothetical protein